MSKFVKIPSYKNPYEVIINGVKYQYPAGETCLVPDGVAMVIKNAENNAPKYAKENVRRPDIVETVSGEVITVSDSAEAPLQGLKVFGKTIQNGTPTPDAPVAMESVGADGDVAVTVAGKNLLNMPRKTETKSGVTWIAEESVLTIIGTTEGLYGDIICKNARIEAGTYTVSFKNLEKLNRIEIDCAYEDGTKVSAMQYVTASKPSFTFTAKEYCYVGMTFVINSGTAFGNENNPTFIYAQIEAGSKITEYEPYKEQNLTISIPNGLPGIPVDSGGNYTDAKGQQWICDEVDFENGVYVQRVGKIDRYNGEALPGAYLSSTGALSTGATVLYQLESDKQTDISAEKLAEYAAMYTNYQSTTVYNDADAGMEVKYVADTKLYVDNKFNVLAAMVNNA